MRTLTNADTIAKCRALRNEAVAAGRVTVEQFNAVAAILHREDDCSWFSAAMGARNIATAHLRGIQGAIPILTRVGVTR